MFLMLLFVLSGGVGVSVFVGSLWGLFSASQDHVADPSYNSLRRLYKAGARTLLVSALTCVSIIGMFLPLDEVAGLSALVATLLFVAQLVVGWFVWDDLLTNSNLGEDI